MKLSSIYKEILKENNQIEFSDLQLKDVTSLKSDLDDPTTNKLFIKLKSNIEKQIDGNVIHLWREMAVSDEWLNQLFDGNMRLGKYWAYTEDKAYSYWNDRAPADHKVVIGIVVQLDQIDWEYTFHVKLHGDNEDYEQEIGMLEGESVEIKSLKIDDNWEDQLHRINDPYNTI